MAGFWPDSSQSDCFQKTFSCSHICKVTNDHSIPYHTIPYHTMPCHAMPCHAMPCHAMPCHAMPCHAMPYHRYAKCILYSMELMINTDNPPVYCKCEGGFFGSLGRSNIGKWGIWNNLHLVL